MYISWAMKLILAVSILSALISTTLSAAEGETTFEARPSPKPGAAQVQVSASFFEVPHGLKSLGATARSLGLTENAADYRHGGLDEAKTLDENALRRAWDELRKSGKAKPSGNVSLIAVEGVPTHVLDEERTRDKKGQRVVQNRRVFEVTMLGKKAEEISLLLRFSEKRDWAESETQTPVRIPLESALVLGGKVNGVYRVILVRVMGPVRYWASQ